MCSRHTPDNTPTGTSQVGGASRFLAAQSGSPSPGGTGEQSCHRHSRRCRRRRPRNRQLPGAVPSGSDEGTRARVQLEVPMRHRGMGLHRLSPAEGSATFLSSAALANVAMTGAPEQLRPFDGPACAGRQECSQLRTHVGLTDPRGEVVDAVCSRTVQPQAQSDTS